uniref:ribosomal protein S3 n=1 Tax=Gormaniella terricola TaxID=2904618 RepID=UPI0021CCDEA0|nr:ribosomal protein S3 [Gormaniella terricola]UWV18281.1 ribosomal protein S3 [Gormaniella terricola]
MGQKIHPFGFRVGITQKHYARWFASPDNYPQYVLEDFLIRKSLYKLLPPENLPKKMEDSENMRVVHIKIERFLRNTIKIKIYAVNPGAFASTKKKTKKFLKNRFPSENRNAQTKNRPGQKKNFKQNKPRAFGKKKQKRENPKVLDFLLKFKYSVQKRVKKFTLLKLKNLLYRFHTLDQLSNIKTFAKLQPTKSAAEILREIGLLSKKMGLLDSYLNKRLSSGKSRNLEKTIVFVNLNLYKARITSKIYKLQTELLKHFPKLANAVLKNVLTPKIRTKTATIVTELQKHADQLLLDSTKNQSGKGQKKESSFSFLYEKDKSNALFDPKLPSSIRLRQNLQQMLNKNYSENFASFQSGRRSLNSYFGKFGQKRVNPVAGSKGQGVPKDLLEKVSQNFAENALNFHSVDTALIEKKLSSRKAKTAFLNENSSIKDENNVKKKKYESLVSRAIQKRMKKNLVLMSLRNRFDKVANFKKVYDTENFTTLCEKIAKIQTFPKITSIEFVSVKNPTLYAVCLANFIVEKLQKRFSFRGSMKKAKEDAMKTPGIKGIKIQIAGRLNGAEIARTEWMRAGRVPLQTLKAKIDYSYKTASTIYGILGVKVWLFKDNNTKK